MVSANIPDELIVKLQRLRHVAYKLILARRRVLLARTLSNNLVIGRAEMRFNQREEDFAKEFRGMAHDRMLGGTEEQLLPWAGESAGLHSWGTNIKTSADQPGSDVSTADSS